MINSANSPALEKKFTLLLHKDSVELTGYYQKKGLMNLSAKFNATTGFIQD